MCSRLIRSKLTVAISPFHSLAGCPYQPLLPESRKVQSNTKADAAATIQPIADQEISQRESWGEEILRRLKATRKKTTVATPMLLHSRHPVSMRGRRITRTYTLLPRQLRDDCRYQAISLFESARSGVGLEGETGLRQESSGRRRGA